MRRIFLDTEFKNLPWTGGSEMLWVGLADESGGSFSAINADVAIDEFWAWCPTVDALAGPPFDLGAKAQEAHRRYWDWDLQLLRRVVSPWPDGWPTELCDLNRAVRSAGITPPPNESAHHPRDDALWNAAVFRLLQAA